MDGHQMWTQQEIDDAITTLENGRTAGPDHRETRGRVGIEMLEPLQIETVDTRAQGLAIVDGDHDL